jgi:DNA-binding NtrC family response regulator
MTKPLLIVDDEPQIRSLLKRLFSRKGYEIIEAPNGQSALSTLREMNGNIAALITDVEMTGMSGLELAKTVQSEFPTIPILVLFADPTAEGELKQSTPGIVFVPKPFDLAMLIQTLRNLLEAIAIA